MSNEQEKNINYTKNRTTSTKESRKGGVMYYNKFLEYKKLMLTELWRIKEKAEYERTSSIELFNDIQLKVNKLENMISRLTITMFIVVIVILFVASLIVFNIIN